MPEDTEHRCTGFEVGSGDYILCDPSEAPACLRSDTVVELDGAARAARPRSR
jgi:hypothetical protein